MHAAVSTVTAAHTHLSRY